MTAKTDTPRNLSSEARVSEVEDGTLIYNERTRNTGRQLSWSSNGGESWSELIHAGDLQVTQCNGSLLTLSRNDGELTNVLLFSGPSAGGRINGLVHVSKDGGKTWPIVKRVVKGNFAYSALVQLEGGRWDCSMKPGSIERSLFFSWIWQCWSLSRTGFTGSEFLRVGFLSSPSLRIAFCGER